MNIHLLLWIFYRNMVTIYCSIIVSRIDILYFFGIPSIADRDDTQLGTLRNQLLLPINVLLRTETTVMKVRVRSVNFIMRLGSQENGHKLFSSGSRSSMGPCQDGNILGANDEYKPASKPQRCIITSTRLTDVRYCIYKMLKLPK